MVCSYFGHVQDLPCSQHPLCLVKHPHFFCRAPALQPRPIILCQAPASSSFCSASRPGFDPYPGHDDEFLILSQESSARTPSQTGFSNALGHNRSKVSGTWAEIQSFHINFSRSRPSFKPKHNECGCSGFDMCEFYFLFSFFLFSGMGFLLFSQLMRCWTLKA